MRAGLPDLFIGHGQQRIVLPHQIDQSDPSTGEMHSFYDRTNLLRTHPSAAWILIHVGDTHPGVKKAREPCTVRVDYQDGGGTV